MSMHAAGLAVDKITPARVLAAIATQMRVVNALVLRETKTRYGNYKIGFLWALIEPLVGVTVFVAIFSNLRSDSPSGMPLVPFMLVGFICYGFFRDPWGSMQGAISNSRNLLTFPQVTTFDVILARGILEIMVCFFVLGFLLYMAHLAGFEVRCERPLGVLIVCGLLCIFGLGVGFLFASLEPLIPSIKQFGSQVMSRPLYFSSGLFFTADTIPAPIREYLLYNPVLHMIELVRGEFFYEFETSYGSWSYACTWAFATFAVGLLTHQAVHKRAIVKK
ncbi:MAG: capsular polysaccharide transport system permease protein [Granulosicoccus sp.]|jgi:capsular polysaccharide transport system permease protein